MVLIFAIRLAACAVLGWMALEKLASPQAAAARLWRPSWLNAAAVVTMVAVVSGAELTVAMVLQLGLVGGWARASAAATVGVLVSFVGLMSARTKRGCGCGESKTASHTVWAVFARNGSLFGVLVTTSLVGPSWEAVRANAPIFGLVSGLAPLMALLGLAAAGAVRRQRQVSMSRPGTALPPADTGSAGVVRPASASPSPSRSPSRLASSSPDSGSPIRAAASTGG